MNVTSLISSIMLSSLVIYLILCAGIAVVNAIPLVVAQPHQISLAGHLENLVDKSGLLTLADILAKPSTNNFEKLPGFVNRGYLTGASWTRFSYTTPAGGPSEWYLRFVPAFLDDVRVYVQEGPDPMTPASYREYQLGDNYPMADRPIMSLDMVAPVPVTDAAPRTVYVRVKTSSTHNLQAWLYPPAGLIAWSGTYAVLVGLMLGILLVVVMVNAFYAVVARSALFTWYSLFVLGHFIRQLGLDGVLLTLWPSGAHLINDWLVGGGVGLCLCTYSLFAMTLFSTREQWPRTHRYLQVNIIIGALSALCIPFGWYGRLAPILIISFLLLSCYAPVLAVEYARQRGPGSGLIIFGFVIAVLPVIPRFLSVLGLIPSTWMTTNAYIFGVLAQAAVMTMALMQRLQVSQQQLLAVTRQAEVWAKDLAEDRTRELSGKKRELEQALAEKHQAYDQQAMFVNMISHEFRTPLAIVSGNLEIIEERGVPDGPLVGPFRKIERAVKRIVEVYSLVLGRTRLDAITPHLDLRPVDPVAFAAEILQRVREQWPDRDFVFTPSVTPEITIDRAMLGTALFNLLDNAAKYTSAEESVTLTVCVDESGIFFEVRDGGPGFALGERERVFEKYHRGAVSAGTVGAGIGLWLVREIVTAHGGTVTLADNLPHGAVGTIRLPVGTITPPVFPLR